LQTGQRLRNAMLLLFFLSGISGLIYQIVWTRLLVLVFGNTLLATSTVVSAFMGGLAAGSYFFGRYVDERPRPLVKLYAGLEAGIGLFALVFPLLLSAATPLYAALYRGLEGNVAILNLARFAICFGLIVVPTFMMGGTLPVLLKLFAAGRGSLGYQAGFLYGLNTTGAVVGCLASGYVLMRLYGMQHTTWVGVAINLGVAVVAWLLPESTRSASPPAADPGDGEAEPLHGPATVRLVLVGIGLSGFCALACELLWARMLNLFLNNNIHSFTAVLATFLTGIAGGSLLYSRFLSGVRRPVRLFAVLQFGIGGFCYATPFVFKLFQSSLFLRQSEALTLAKTSAIMIAPTLLMGMSVPLAVQICRRGSAREGSTLGTVYAANTVGSILGAFAAGFVLVPFLGLHMALIGVVALNLLAGLLALLPTVGRGLRPVWSVAFAGLLAALYLTAPPTLFRNLYQAAQPTTEILHYKEGRIANVVVYDFFKSGYKDLFLNAIEEASSRVWHVQLFKMLGILPPMMHPAPDNALMVAFGAGMSAGAAADHVSSLEVVDLNPDVYGVAETFTHENLDIIHNPKFSLVVNDGRNALLLNPQKYSVIISDATNPKTFDSWTLYTREFYELARSRLKLGGVFCQWLVIPLPDDAIKILLSTVRDVFPHTSFWCIYGSSQCMVLATPERLAIDHDELSARLAPKWESSGLAEYGIGDTDKFLSYLLLGEDELETALAGFTTLNTDDLPHAQFRTKGHVEGVRAFLDLMEHQRSAAVYLTGDVPPERAARLEDYRSLSRRLNLGFLMNNQGEFEEARAVARAAGFYPDQNVRSTLKYDQKRKEYFLDRIETHETDANAHNTLGYIYWREGNLDDAIRELTRATDLNPDFVNAYATLARVFADAGRFDEAEATWLAVRERNPAGSMLSTVRRELRIVYLRRRLSYEPDSPSLNLLLGEIYARAARNVESAELLRTAAKANPGNLEIHVKLAGLYENLEFVEDALDTYRTLALLRPGDERMTQKVQEFEIMARDPEAEQRWLNSTEFVLSEPGSGGAGHPEACREAGELWNDFPFDGKIESGALRRAAELYEEAAAQRSDDKHVYAAAASIYEALGEYGRAATVWRKALVADPADRNAEDHARRLELLQMLEDGGPDAGSVESWVEIGRLYRRDGEVADATAYFQKALRADPRNAQTRSDLVGAHVAAGRYGRAIETLEDGLALQPDPRDASAMTERLRTLRELVGQ